MSQSWYLKLMGFPELRRPDGRAVNLKVRKHLALLIYLVVDTREVYFRDELAELLWPDVPDVNGRHSLSMGFSVLRGLFGRDCIRGNHAEIEFSRPDFSLDLDRLDCGEILGGESTPQLEVDGFLRDFHVEGAPGFQHWCDRRNAQLLPLIQAGILLLTDEARRSGDLSRMLALADRLLELDPLAEEGVRARMEVFALQGDRVTALRIFEAWKRQLSEELGAVPSELLEGLACRLRRRSVAAASGAGDAVARPDPWAERRFVGRNAEYRALFETWESTTQLNTSHVLLSGETGIGKSTLAMRFASAAALEGAAVARVQCFELEQRIAFGMIGALITSLLDRPGVVGTAPESLAEVARIVPKVRERFAHLPAPRQSEGEAARLRFAEGTFALFDAIMEEQPLVLIVDDYPRSDEASLSVLHMLLRRAHNAPLMVVLSGRPPEPDEPPQAARIRKGVSYLPLRHLDLAPLSEAESEDLIHGLLVQAHKQPGYPERRAIVRTSGGNPMALELLTQDWINHGEAALVVSLPAMSADIPGSALEAIGYDRLIDRLLPALTPRTRIALYLGAILGPRLNELEYFSVVDLTPAQTMATLSEMVERRVLRNTEKGLEFVNELVRARLYLKIPIASRTRLHDGVAARMLEAVARGESIPALEIAWHCIRAHRREEATPYLMSGARDAITHGAPDEAARALSSAMGHLRGRAKAEAVLLLAETYQEMAEWETALRYLVGSSHLTVHEPVLRELAQTLEMDSRRHLGLYLVDELPSIAEQLAAKARNDQSRSARIKAAHSAMSVATRLRRPDIPVAVREAILSLPLNDLDARDQGRALLALAMAHYQLREGEKGIEQVAAAARLLEMSQTADTTYVQIQMGFGAIACANGAYADGIKPLERALAAATRLDNTPFILQAVSNLALCHYRLGNLRESLDWSIKGWDKADTAQVIHYESVHCAAQCGRTNVKLGKTREAMEAFGWLKAASHKATTPSLRQTSMLHEADLAWLLGHREHALETIRSMIAEMQGVPSIGFAGRVARWNTVLLVRTDTPEEALPLLEVYYEQIERLDVLDQAEVLCSLYSLGQRGVTIGPQIADEARRTLAKLPLACTVQLRDLGLRIPN